MTTPIINITGETVALGPLRRDLLPLHVRWANDFDVWRTVVANVGPRPAETQTTWFDRVSTAADTVVFLIYERSSMRPIGAAGLHEIDHATRTASYSIAIGEKDCWGKGYGTETTRLLLAYGFSELRLHNIMLFAHSDNAPAIAAYRRAGFREIGRRREALSRAGRPIDLIYMDCLATEFEQR